MSKTRGLEFGLRIEEMTEFVRSGACGCVYYWCRILCSFHYIVLLHRGRGREGKKKKKCWDLKCDLRAIYTRCVSICSANIAERA